MKHSVGAQHAVPDNMVDNVPGKHHRHSIRLSGYDYSQEGAYYVTVDAWKHECLFGIVVDAAMHLNEYGKIANECWSSIPEHFAHVELDEYIVMPNHVHGIFLSWITVSTKCNPYP